MTKYCFEFEFKFWKMFLEIGNPKKWIKALKNTYDEEVIFLQFRRTYFRFYSCKELMVVYVDIAGVRLRL